MRKVQARSSGNFDFEKDVSAEQATSDLLFYTKQAVFALLSDIVREEEILLPLTIRLDYEKERVGQQIIARIIEKSN